MTDITPEHTKRQTPEDKPPHDEVLAAYDYVSSVVKTADTQSPLMWFGWALCEAFLAGITFQKESKND